MLNPSDDRQETVLLDEHSSQRTDDLVPLIKALADPTRLRIFAVLMEGVQCNCEIAERLGLSLSLISHHLSILRRVGLVESERDREDARWIYYAVQQDALRSLRESLMALLDPARIQPRQPLCGPRICPRR